MLALVVVEAYLIRKEDRPKEDGCELESLYILSVKNVQRLQGKFLHPFKPFLYIFVELLAIYALNRDV